MVNKHTVFYAALFVGSAVWGFSDLEKDLSGMDSKREQQERITDAFVEVIISDKTEERLNNVVQNLKKLEASLKELGFGTAEDFIETLSAEDAQAFLPVWLGAKKLVEQAADLAKNYSGQEQKIREMQLQNDAFIFFLGLTGYLQALGKHEITLKEKYEKQFADHADELVAEKEDVLQRWQRLRERFEQKARGE